MGNPAFYYYPSNNPQHGVVKISLPKAITHRGGPKQMIDRSVSTSFSGQRTIVQFAGREEIMVEFHSGAMVAADRLTRRELEVLLNHLKRGNRCIYVEDDAWLFAAAVQAMADVGDSFISVHLPFTDEIVTTPDLTGREVVLRGSPPHCLRETFLVQTVVGSGHTFSTPVRFDWSLEAWAILREWGTFVAMRIPERYLDDPILTHESETVWHLNLPLEEDESVLEGLALTGMVLIDSGGGDGVGLDDPDLPGGGGVPVPDDPVAGGKNPGAGNL